MNRSRILLRLLKALICLIAFELTKALLYALVLFQHLWALVTKESNEPVRRFTCRAACYAHLLLRYAGMCDNEAPFPFATLPLAKDCPKNTANPDLGG